MDALMAGDFTRADDPLLLFQTWLDEARRTEINDPEAMALATADADGLPDVRMVLMKGFDARGVVFYTNGQSAKGREIAATGKAAALFHWKSLRRQIRIRGAVSGVTEAEADAYFATRHPQSQVGAWASQQSRPLAERKTLEDEAARLGAKFAGGPVPRPPHWTGFRIALWAIEFWADGAYRLHDRVLFTPAAEGGWSRQRLHP